MLPRRLNPTLANAVLALGFLAVAIFYSWLQWTSEVPVLGGDHALYLLMADRWSPFGVLSAETIDAIMVYSYLPPLYPFLVGLLGGTSANVPMAHFVTVTFLLSALVAYFFWARRELNGAASAFALTVAFAAMPATFFSSFGILSENLYLLLTLIAIALLTQARVSAAAMYAAAITIGLSVLCRTAGVTLVAAFAVYLFLHQPRRRWLLPLLCCAAPALAWAAVKWLKGYGGEVSYLWIINTNFGAMSMGDFIGTRLFAEARAIWAGWIESFDHFPSLLSIIIASALGAIALAGCALRIYQKKFDGIYVLLYLLMILLWFSTPDTVRFLYVVLPILLLQGFLLVRTWLHRFATRKWAKIEYVYVAIILLTILPAIGSLLKRAELAKSPEYASYGRSMYWYSTQKLERAKLKIDSYRQFIDAWRRIPAVVAKDECIYSTDPTWLMLYADRKGYSTPWVRTKEEYRERTKNCRYVYAGSYQRTPFPTFYPMDYIAADGKVVFADRARGVEGQPVLGVLVEVKHQ